MNINSLQQARPAFRWGIRAGTHAGETYYLLAGTEHHCVCGIDVQALLPGTFAVFEGTGLYILRQGSPEGGFDGVAMNYGQSLAVFLPGRSHCERRLAFVQEVGGVK